jgi:nucleotide sugar dehydrogenase
MNMKIGFIGQGWIGKNLADHFEERGFETIRFAKEEPYNKNEEALKECDIVFVAVPTPTTPEGFDDSILRGVLRYARAGQSVVIKSTILPGTTDALAKENPHLFIFHAPEFLREASVRKDIDQPDRNILGIPNEHFSDEEWQQRAAQIMDVLPDAPYKSICRAPEAELTKYGGNNFLYMKLIFVNLLHDLAETHNVSWDVIAENMKADPRIGASHMQPIHQYAHMADKIGRGAGGHCFIKDFAAMRHHFEDVRSSDKETITLLRALEAKNNQLLQDTEKDPELLYGVYGDNILCLCRVHGDNVDCTCKKDLVAQP